MKQTVPRPLTVAVFILAIGAGHAQVTTPFNQPNAATDFVGWDNTVTTDPLMIKHEANQPIEWFTFDIPRMRLNPDVIGPMGPGVTPPFPNIPRDGFLLLSGQPDAFTNIASRAPFTRLHLIDDATSILNPVVYAQEHGYRPWQRNGITFTGNSDQSYIGHKYDANDNTDFVVQWSDNPASSPWGTDRLKFVFTTTYNAGANRGAATWDGLEAMRFWPRGNMEVNVGIGDFAPPAIGDPTERLDVLDGRVRIRQLPDDPETTDPYLVMVVDNTGAPERGVVKWVDPNNLPGGGGQPDCDWEVLPNGDVVTAYDPAAPPNCPNDESRVGIGTDAPEAKLHVFNAWANPGIDNSAGFFHNTFNSGVTVGIDALSEAPSSGIVVGGRGTGRYGGRLYGLWGIAESGASGTGVRAEAYGSTSNTGSENVASGGISSVGVTSYAGGATSINYGMLTLGQYGFDAMGIHAAASNGTNANYGVRAMAVGNNPWAGWFDGDVHITGDASCTAMAWTSDGSLKTNVEDIENALEFIGQLRPTTYVFAPTPTVDALPTGLQRGFVAQELEIVLPDLVRDITYPAQIDSLGNIVKEEATVKGVNYICLIPMLTAAIQEQQTQLSEQAARLDQLEQALALCCTNPSDGQQLQTPDGGIEGRMLPDAGSERLLTIAPNPFTEQTTVSYTLERGGRAMLMVNGSDGKHLQVLEEGARSEGQYQYVWHTAHLAPGVYYVTLLLDGEPLVKRAVKVR